MLCNRCGHDNPASHKFCSECGHSLLRAPREAERRSLTVMFCDLADSTSLSEQIDPEELQKILTTYQECCQQIILRFGGFIAKYMGDGILVYFGYPTAHEDDAQRAVRAALEISKAVPELIISSDYSLAVRTGIATGSVVIGDIIGEGTAEEISVLGLTPNLAARLQSVAGKNETVISDATRQRLGQMFSLHDLGRLSLKGISTQTQVWRVEKLAAANHRPLSEAPFVGREDSMTILGNALEKAQANKLEIVHIVGQPGIGKTRLIKEFLETVTDTEIIIWTCSAFHRHVPFHPVPGNLTTVSAPQPGTGKTQRQQIFDAITASLSRKATDKPIILVIEDAHWVDPTTAEYLMSVEKRLSDQSILLLTISRPGEMTDQLLAAMKGTRLELEPILDTDAYKLVTTLAGNAVSDDLCTKIIQRAGGLPLFLEELANVVSSDANEDIPDSLQELLLTRLDGLGPAKRIAQLASVFGHTFSKSELFALDELSGINAEPLFDQLLSKGLFITTGFGYRFRHALMQEVSYETLLLSTRRRLHTEIANRLIAQGTNIPPETIARHLSGADHPAEAAPYWCKAAHHSAKLWSHEEAAIYYHNALEHAAPGTDDKWEMNTRLDLIESLRIIDRYTEALAQLDIVEQLAAHVATDEDWLRIHVLRGNILFPLAKPDLSIASQEAALAVAKKLNFPEAQARALSGMGDAYFASRRLPAAERAYDACVKLAEQHGLDEIILSNISLRGHMRLYLCQMDQAESDCRRSVAMSIRTGNRRAEMTALGSCLGKVLMEKGAFSEADNAFARATEIAVDLGAHRFEALNLIFRSKVALENGQRTDAWALGMRAVELARASAPKFCLPLAIGVIARAEETFSVCKAALDEAEGLIAEGCFAHNHLWFYREAGLAMLHHNRPDEARRHAKLLRKAFASAPLPWCNLIAEGIEALAAYTEHKDTAVLQTAIQQARNYNLGGWAYTIEQHASHHN